MRPPVVAAVCAVLAAAVLPGPAGGSAPDLPQTVVRVHTVGRAVDHLGRSLTDLRPGQRRVSLGVVFDSTGSMYDDLRQLIRGVEEVLQLALKSETHIIDNFILVPFHDPVIGPAVVTDDYHQFHNSLKMLDFRDGGDCPEMALTGLKLALEEALPGSHIYVFTDASAKDHHMLEEIISLISDKEPHIVFVLTGDCSDPDGPGQTVFKRIAAITAGHVFHLKKDSVQQVLQFVRESLRPMKVNLAAVDHSPPQLTSTDGDDRGAESDRAPPPSVNIHVDQSLDEFTVSVSGNRPEVTIHNDENQTSVTGDLILDLPKVKVVNIKNPRPGRYRVSVDTEDSAFSLRATAISGVTFDFGFTQQPEAGLEDALDRPADDELNYLLVRPVNASGPLRLRHAELVSLEGAVLRTVLLGPPDGQGVQRGGPLRPPRQQLFRVKVHGTDSSGAPVQRETSAVSAVSIGKPVLEAQPEVIGHLGANVSIPCRVRSYLPMRAGWHFEYQPFSAFTNYSQSSQSRVLNLQMSNVTEADAGTYICLASNALGKASQYVRLKVLAPPPVVETPRNVTVLDGHPVYLRCDVTSDTPYNVTWRRAEWLYGKKPISRPGTTDYLHIPAATINHGGRYQCTAANAGGEVTSETILSVHAPPKVSVRTPGRVFLPRQQVVITCQAYGQPHPDIVWTRGYDDVVIDSVSEDGRVQADRSILRIDNARQSDEGVYTCTGTNEYGRATQSLYIQYAEPPRVSVPDKPFVASIGASVTLHCDVTGLPDPTVTWLRSSVPLQSSGLVKVAGGRLHLLAVKGSDAGTYTCAAENDYGRDTAPVTLNIGSAPVIIVRDYDVPIAYGGSTTLPCVAVGSPEPTVRWSRPGQRLTDVTDAGTLNIDYATMDDAGPYTCTATNEYGTDTVTVNVTVRGAVPPVLSDVPAGLSVELGSPLSLPCAVLSALPPPTLRWHHDGLPVVEGGGRWLRADGTLRITAARRRDAGEYTCTAENAAGTTSVTTRVSVHYAPDIEDSDEKPLEVPENSTVFLACDVTADPVPRVIWVKHGQLEIPLDGRLWVHPNNTLQISAVTEDDAGVYSCHVNNTRGAASARRPLLVHAPPRIVGIEADVVASDGRPSPSPPYGVEDTPTREPRLERRELATDRGQVVLEDGEPSLTVTEGDEVTVLCDLRPDDVARVTWERSGGAPASGTQLDNGGIRFTASEQSQGTYQCKASNEFGTAAAPLKLNVKHAPKSSRRTYDVNATLGDDLTLSCVVRGRPKPAITWLRLGRRIRGGGTKYSRGEDDSLTIHNVQHSDAGLYKCRANNAIGSLTKLTNVTVLEPPVVTSDLDRKLAVRTGEPLRLKVQITGAPRPDLLWTKDGVPLPPESGAIQEESGDLLIPNASPSDAGKYALHATSPAGKAVYDFKVDVISVTVNDAGVSDRQVIDGETFEMDCPISGDVRDIKWFKNGERIADPLVRTRSDQTHVVIGEGGRVLRIPEVTAEDSAEYTCVADTAAGGVRGSAELEVLVPPRFADPFFEPKQKILDEQEQLSLNCQVNGHPTPQVRWFLDGEPISPDSIRGMIVSADGEKLTIWGRLETAGTYTCEAVNSAGRITRQFPVRVEVAPRPAGPDPQYVTVHRGDSVTLNCSVVGAPRPRYAWNKDDQQVVSVTWAEPGFVYYPLLGDDKERLFVDSARLRDAGEFKCVGKNRLGTASRRTILTVNGAPVILVTSEDVQRRSVTPGDRVTLRCPVQSYPLATVTWTKDGELLKTITPPERPPDLPGSPFGTATELLLPEATRRRRRRRDIDASSLSDLSAESAVSEPTDGEDWSEQFSPGDTTLTVDPVRAADDGLYTCTASNEHGRAAVQVVLHVTEAPTILESPAEHRVNQHEPTTLQCETTGIPAPFVFWRKDGVPISELSIPHLYEAEDTAEVTIQMASPEMAGTYTCVAENSAGTATRDTQLSVIVPPEIVSPASLDVSVVESDGQTLTCQLTRDDPEARVTWLHEGVPLDRTELQYTLRDDNRTLLISSISRTDAGDFTCLASNTAGHSELTYDVQVLVPVYFEDETEEYREKIHRSLLIRCPAVGVPAPDITWYKDGTAVSDLPDSGMSAAGVLLRIDRLRPDHAGSYTCRAANVVSEDSRTVTVTVLEPPEVSELPASLTVAAGSPLELVCSAAGRPAPRLAWQLEGAPLTTDIPGEVVVPSAGPQHTGLYSCVAWNEVGTDRREVYVSVIAPPVLDEADPARTAVEHEPVVIRCPLERGDSDTQIVWSRDGTELWSNTSSVFITEDERALLLPAVRTEDAGDYSCRAENALGAATHLTQLTVQVPPRLKEYPEYLTARQGDNVTIECETEAGDPAPERVWRRNGVLVTPGGSVELLPSGALRLLRVGPTDVASYTCRVYNPAGEAVRRALLDVRTPPTAAVRPSNVTVLAGDPLRVLCDVTGHPEPDRVTWLFTSGQRRASSTDADWPFAAYMASDNHIYKQRADPSDAGQLRCVAASPEGRADAVATVAVLTTPTFVAPSAATELTVRAGAPVELDCRVEGLPTPKVLWLRDGMGLPLLPDGSDQTLSLPPLAPTDGGNYSCIAASDAGQAVRQFALTVLSAPNIRRVNATIDAKQGTPVEMVCSVESTDKFTIVWEKDGAAFSPSLADLYHLTDGGQTLHILRAHPEHGGNYSCRATSRAGADQQNFSVSVLTPARAEPGDGVKMAPDGTFPLEVPVDSGVRLECRRSGNPAPEAVWTKDGQVVKTVAATDPDSALLLEPAKLVDSGSYSCRVSNSLGSDSVDYTLEVYSLPTLRRELEYTVNARPRENVTLTCDVTGHPAPQVTWYKDGQKLESQLAKVEIEGYSLLVRDVGPSDAANYTCYAVNKAGLLVVPLQLQLFEPPRVSLPSRSVGVEGRDLHLECAVTGQPAPSVLWYRLGQEVGTEARIHALGNHLTVQSVGPFDRGEYECFAKNRAGTDRATVDLRVIEVPRLETFEDEESIVTSVGEAVVLPCPVDTEHIGEYRVDWLRDGEPLSGAGYLASNLALELTYPLDSDAGDIMCRVTNEAGSVSYLFRLDVLYAPRLTIPESELREPIQVEEGQPLSLTCYVEGNPEPTVIWYNHSEPFISETERVTFPSARELLLQSVRPGGADQLQCRAQNALGAVTQTFALDVLTQPGVAVPRQSSVEAGATVRLPCAVTGNPPPTRVWYTAEDALSLPPGGVVANYAHLAETGELLVTAASLDDLGVYTCVATNTVGSTRGRSALRVLVAPSVEGSSDEPESVRGREGESVSLRCPVSGHPPPTIAWYKDDDVLRQPDLLSDAGQTLTLRQLAPADAGSYVCVAANSAGTARKRFSLHVTGTPLTQTDTVELDADVNTTVTLSCRSAGPADFSTVWLRRGRRVGGDTELKLENVQKKDGGRYQCISSSLARTRVTKYNIRIKVPPRLVADVPPASSVRPEVGYPLRLTCPIEGAAPLRWLKNMRPITERDGVIFDGRLGLIVLSVSVSDSGQYSCEAQNSAGQAVHKFDVQVVVPPHFESPAPDRVTARAGEDVTLTCDATGLPAPNVTWYKGASVVSRKAQVHLSPVDVSADGVYTCTAENEAGRARHEVVLDVLEPPVISGPPSETVRVALGGNAVLPCVTKSPLPSVSWEKAGSPVRLGSPRIKLTSHGLQLTRARTDDRGKYRCLVKNDAGRAERFIRLVVSAPAQVEERSLYLVVGEQLALVCPEFDVSSGPTESTEWSIDAKGARKLEKVLDKSLKVPRVRPSHEGRYRCQATSETGEVKAVVWNVHVKDTIDLYVEPSGGAVTSSEGDQLTLRCQTESGSGVQLVWYRNNSQLDLSERRYANSAAKTKGSVVVNSLVIDGVTAADEGQYVCRGQAGKVQREQAIKVRVTTRPSISSPSPPESTLRPGQALHLRCAASGRPPPVLRWFHGQTLLEDVTDGRVTVRDGELRVEPFQLSDAGEYMCVAINSIGKAAKMFNVAAEMAPRFTITPKDLLVPTMGNFTVECAAEGAPLPLLSWLRDGRPVAARAPQPGRTSWSVHLAGPEDGGIYTCEARNEVAVRRVGGNVTLFQRLGPPRLAPMPDEVRLREGVRGQLSCRSDSDSKPVIRWQKNGQELTGEAAAAVHDGGQLLVFSSPAASDAGLYRCLATNAAGTSSRRVKLVVERPAHIMERPPATAAVPAGSPLTLPCTASGWPRPVILWQRQGRVLSSTEELQQLADGSLRVAAVEPRLAGTYTCIAKNVIGTDMATVEIAVEEPSTPVAASWSPSSPTVRVPAGRAAPLCRLSGYQPDHHLVRVTHEGTSLATEGLAEPGGPPGELQLRLPAVAERHAGRYTCTLVDHRTGAVLKQEIELRVDSGWGDWSDCSVTCGTGVRFRYRDCDKFTPCRQPMPCVLPECAVPLRSAVGTVMGEVNSTPIGDGRVNTVVVGDLERGELESLITGVNGKLTPGLVPLLPLLTPVPWLAAQRSDGANNGLDLSAGMFRKQSDVMFPTGEKLSITHIGLGIDNKGQLTYDTEIKGQLPETPRMAPGASVEPAHFRGDLVQTGEGDLHAHSTQYYQAGAGLVPFVVNETVTYDGARGQMKTLVQSLDIESSDLHHDVTENRVTFRVTSLSAPGGDQCPEGFLEVRPRNVTFCQDVDECADSPCSHQCVNIVSSFRCECPPGFTVRHDRRTCADVDECAWGMAQCPADTQCENTPGSYRCVESCGPGLRQVPGAAGCFDIDECRSSPSPCEQLCHNTRGNFSCDCYQGYQLVDGGRCVDIDECNQMLGACSHSCINVPGSYRCTCPPGLRLLPNGKCTDIDECAAKMHNCHYDEQCVNTVGSFKCVRPCQRGFKLTGTGECVDIDECAKMIDRCHFTQECRNLQGSYRCICPPGFRSDGPGFPCTDINECDIAGTCQHNCTNLDGGFICSCPSGYRLNPNKRTCDDIDECSENGVTCAADHTCFNKRGSYSCADVSCPAGYVRDPGTSLCLKRCRQRSECIPGTWYSGSLSHKLLALPAGVGAGQDVVELRVSDLTNPGRHVQRTFFRLAQRSGGAPFGVRRKNGRGVLYTTRPLPAGAEYRLEIDGFTYSQEVRGWQETSKFVVSVAVSMYPY
ncbi:hemicentin-1-like isoform X2 [Amphibalanus amphitrite]|uniref:hemicentin-1-like isoform X2 n=2 Tax=Amphibalanus amphitrite TaxID=1232801 RepID=UPI001C8FF7EF|nr:hemicentin-1-like isoform X2 [Amphibalanus amphitrite]